MSELSTKRYSHDDVVFSVRNRTRLIVGIDYGTTYSGAVFALKLLCKEIELNSVIGISFAMSNATDIKDIHPWTAYPGSSAHNSGHNHKAPSWVALAEDNPEDLSENAWGYLVEPGMRTYAWTKLLLDDRAISTEYDDPGLKKAVGGGLSSLPLGKDPKFLVTEYFRGMYKMFVRVATEKIGPESLKALPIDVWLTVPATWTERAKILTRDAALKAGFCSNPVDRIFLIPEPEAAAHITLKTKVLEADSLVDRGSGVMICDCGGGTVDITTYEILRVQPVLKLRELCVGIAGKCGGTFVDRNLYELMSARFGDDFDSLDPEQTGPSSQFMDLFELRKRDFSMDSPSTRPARLFLPMPRLRKSSSTNPKHYDKRYSSVLLSSEDMKSLYDPVIDKIINLIDNQVEQASKEHDPGIQTIILVGGFGSCPYVRERLQQWCILKSIRLTTPLEGGWSAVVRGAVLRGIEGCAVTTRKCRKHYGLSSTELYDQEKHGHYDHPGMYQFVDKWTGQKRQAGFIDWITPKGTVLDKTSSMKYAYYRVTTPGKRSQYTKRLYACSLDTPPTTVDSDQIEIVGEVSYNYHDKLNFSSLPNRKDENGNLMYKLDLNCYIRLADDAGVLNIQVTDKNGVEYGTAELDVL